MQHIEEFVAVAQRAEKILTMDEVPYNVPLWLHNISKLENSKFESYIMQAQVITLQKTSSAKWQFSAHIKRRFNVDTTWQELEKKVQNEQKDNKLVIPSEGLSAIGKRTSFSFYLPKRLCELCSDTDRLTAINSKSYLGVFAGKRNKSMSLILAPLSAASKQKRNTTIAIDDEEDDDNVSIEETSAKKRKGEQYEVADSAEEA